MRHGTYLGYIADGCRDECCRRPWRAYIGRQRLRDRRGEPSRLVDAAPAREHALEMRRYWGVSARRVVEAAGVERSYALLIVNGTTTRMDRGWRDAVLAVGLEDLDPATLMPVNFVWSLVDRFQSEFGWDRKRIARESGLPPWRLHLRGQERVGVGVYVALRDRLRAACMDCGAVTFAGGVRCWGCYQQMRGAA